MEIIIVLLASILSTVPVVAVSLPTETVETTVQADSLHLAATNKAQDPSYLGIFRLSRYYSPQVGQTLYYKNREYDISMNC